MLTIENDFLRISINTKGAELNNIFSKQTQLEYLWNGDPAFWSKRSPILFPIVGALRDNTYYYKNNAYQLSRHGFARDAAFTCTANEATSVTMTLTSNDETLAVYPFLFQLNVNYSLHNDRLVVTYQVTNTGNDDMLFSIGGHPAFRLPIDEQLSYNDYHLEFSNNENLLRWPISPEGLVEAVPGHFMVNSNKIPLSKELFEKDAIVFKYLDSETITIKSNKSPHSVIFRFTGFPFFGIWAAPNANFVCLEPWCGIADSTMHDQQLVNKEGINLLAPGQTFTRSWEVSVN